MINRFKALSLKIKVNKEIKRSVRKRAYEIKLQHLTGFLPRINSLRKWRNAFVLAAIIVIAVPIIQMMFFCDTMHYRTNFQYVGSYKDANAVFLYNIPTLSFIISSILTTFAGTVDFAIYRRFGNKKSFIEW